MEPSPSLHRDAVSSLDPEGYYQKGNVLHPDNARLRLLLRRVAMGRHETDTESLKRAE